MRRSFRTKSIALLALLALPVSAWALASNGRLSYKGCIADRGKNGCVAATHNSLKGAIGVAVSPDDKSVYFASILGNSVTEFKRRPSGTLRFAGCTASKPAHGCTELQKYMMWGAVGVDVSPDDRSVYVASFIGGSLSRFKRAPNGSLTYAGCFENGGFDRCKKPAHNTLSGAGDVAVSPDGKSVYVSDIDSNSITTFHRRPNGSLAYAGCIANNGARDCRKAAHNSLLDAIGIAVSPDGASVYVSSSTGVTRFRRGSGGGLTYAGCVSFERFPRCGRAAHRSLSGAWGIAVSPDGKSLYVVGRSANALTRFQRRPNGALRYAGCISNHGGNGCAEADHASLQQPAEVAVSPDGESVYVAARRSKSLTRFRRASAGGLHYGSCVANRGAHGCRRARHSSLDAASGVAVSPDSGSVYVGSFVGDSVTRFRAR